MQRLLFVIVSLLFFGQSFSQTEIDPTETSTQSTKQSNHKPSGKTVRIVLIDSTSFTGKVIERNEDYTIIETSGQTTKIENRVIKSIEYIKDDRKKFKTDWLTSSRAFISSTAIPLKKKEVRISSTLGLLNGASYGFTKFFSVSAGFEFSSFLLTVFGQGYPMTYLTPKLNFKLGNNVYMGGGVTFVFYPNILDDPNATGITTYNYKFVNLTIGNNDRHITIGTGALDSGSSLYTIPDLNMSAHFRVSEKVALMSENHLLSSPDNINSQGSNLYFGVHGIRLANSRRAWDFGILVLSDFIETTGAPYAGFNLSF